jgi:hypothetical protein
MEVRTLGISHPLELKVGCFSKQDSESDEGDDVLMWADTACLTDEACTNTFFDSMEVSTFTQLEVPDLIWV